MRASASQHETSRTTTPLDVTNGLRVGSLHESGISWEPPLGPASCGLPSGLVKNKSQLVALGVVAPRGAIRGIRVGEAVQRNPTTNLAGLELNGPRGRSPFPPQPDRREASAIEPTTHGDDRRLHHASITRAATPPAPAPRDSWYSLYRHRVDRARSTPNSTPRCRTRLLRTEHSIHRTVPRT